ncbi:hypothetical protein JCM21714_2115 [Gracilibacillus boraciitolerans JCM 21714]|uniref:Uncharacterized protein n=1 Tax=Gracilibacillus boraciitolerans JCM 21714 TaxID=1298598 RepID=W4VJS8_9BACI|nr:hypothetical protein [Gracilibacillus boraciitolerans]GAE93078.1 hypothetical protein JCM21714_2115 [Gracilibacillus boraciitolerans JCM 21714]
MKIVMQIIYSIGIILFILLFNFNNVYAQQIVDDKKWISGQTTSYYNAGGYSGSLSSYIYSGSYTPSDTIWISGQTTSYYNASGYSGSLSSYVYSGSYTPSESKNANYTCYNTLVYVYNSEGKRLASPDYQNQLCLHQRVTMMHRDIQERFIE